LRGDGGRSPSDCLPAKRTTTGDARRHHAQEKTAGEHIKLSYHRVDKRWHDPRDRRSHLADPAVKPKN
jgi:hypothetical protein